MHYAAGCPGTAPLEYLVSVGANLEDVDKQGCTPLMIACMVNNCPVTALLNALIVSFVNIIQRVGLFSWPIMIDLQF